MSVRRWRSAARRGFTSWVSLWMQLVGTQWLMGTLTHSTLDVALLSTALGLPFLVVAIPAGALGDTRDRRQLLIVGQASMFLAAAVLWLLSATRAVTPLLLLLLTAALGSRAPSAEMLEDGQHAADVWGVGVGLPGPVDFEHGVTVNPPIMPGSDRYPVAKRLAARFAAPVLVDNDVNVMATGEHWARWREVEHLLFVKVGTGIGSRIIASGAIHRGEDGAAGDIGHTHISRAR